MAIRNADGSPYQVSGSLQQFDPNNPEHCLFNEWDSEVIRIGGSPIFYYELFIQTQTLDPIHREDRGKLYAQTPIQLWGLYEPMDAQYYQNMFGIEGVEDMAFEFNYSDVVNLIGHAPKVGSRLYTPHLGESWRIIQPTRGEWAMWGALRLKLFCMKWQETTTDRQGAATQRQVDFSIDDIGV